MKILTFAATSSKKSINNKLAVYAVSLLDNITTENIDLNEYELPLFSEDKEIELGQPELAKSFLEKIKNSDAIVISFAEHNGSYSAAYKNIFDWCSRINPKVYQNKPMILLSTSPGPGGASSVLSTAIDSMPHFDGDVKGYFSLPNFYDNFDIDNNIILDNSLRSNLLTVIKKIQS